MSQVNLGEKKSRIVLTLPHKLKHELKVLAVFDNQSIGEIALSYIKDGVNKNREKIAKVFSKK